MDIVENINKLLIAHYGVDSNNNLPQFRVVWANDQVEKRLMEYDDHGMKLLFPEVREVKKYWYMKDMYILERLVLVNEEDQKELCGLKMSYEPIWGFADDNRNPLPPNWDVAKLVVDTLYAALGKKSMRKYVEVNDPAAKEAEIAKLQQELFGNETDVSDALAYKEGIVVPSNYKEH